MLKLAYKTEACKYLSDVCSSQIYHDKQNIVFMILASLMYSDSMRLSTPLCSKYFMLLHNLFCRTQMPLYIRQELYSFFTYKNAVGN